MYFCCSSPPDVRFLRRLKIPARCLRRLLLPLPRANLRRRNRKMHLLVRQLREQLLLRPHLRGQLPAIRPRLQRTAPLLFRLLRLLRP